MASRTIGEGEALALLGIGRSRRINAAGGDEGAENAADDDVSRSAIEHGSTWLLKDFERKASNSRPPPP
jgi:hypothetical protein